MTLTEAVDTAKKYPHTLILRCGENGVGMSLKCIETMWYFDNREALSRKWQVELDDDSVIKNII